MKRFLCVNRIYFKNSSGTGRIATVEDEGPSVPDWEGLLQDLIRDGKIRKSALYLTYVITPRTCKACSKDSGISEATSFRIWQIEIDKNNRAKYRIVEGPPNMKPQRVTTWPPK